MLLFLIAVATAQPGPLIVPIHAILVSDDDGDRTTVPMTAEQGTPWVEFANDTYRPAAVSRTTRASCSRLRSTRVNNMEGTSDREWRDGPGRRRTASLRSIPVSL